MLRWRSESEKEKCFRIKLYHLQRDELRAGTEKGMSDWRTTNLWNWKKSVCAKKQDNSWIMFRARKIFVFKHPLIHTISAFVLALYFSFVRLRFFFPTKASLFTRRNNFKDLRNVCFSWLPISHSIPSLNHSLVWPRTCVYVEEANERYRLSHKEKSVVKRTKTKPHRIKYDWGRFARRGRREMIRDCLEDVVWGVRKSLAQHSNEQQIYGHGNIFMGLDHSLFPTSPCMTNLRVSIRASFRLARWINIIHLCDMSSWHERSKMKCDCYLEDETFCLKRSFSKANDEICHRFFCLSHSLHFLFRLPCLFTARYMSVGRNSSVVEPTKLFIKKWLIIKFTESAINTVKKRRRCAMKAKHKTFIEKTNQSLIGGSERAKLKTSL